MIPKRQKKNTHRNPLERDTDIMYMYVRRNIEKERVS